MDDRQVHCSPLPPLTRPSQQLSESSIRSPDGLLPPHLLLVPAVSSKTADSDPRALGASPDATARPLPMLNTRREAHFRSSGTSERDAPTHGADPTSLSAAMLVANAMEEGQADCSSPPTPPQPPQQPGQSSTFPASDSPSPCPSSEVSSATPLGDSRGSEAPPDVTAPRQTLPVAGAGFPPLSEP